MDTSLAKCRFLLDILPTDFFLFVLQLKNFPSDHSCGSLYTHSGQCIRWVIIFSEEGFGVE